MQTVIITDSPRKAEFVNKGFKYESFSADIVNMGADGDIKNYLSFYDGIFILSDDFQRIKNTINMCRFACPSVPVFILTEKLTNEIAELKSDKSAMGVFIRPFSFEVIASEMRFHIYKIKDSPLQRKLVLRDLEMDLLRREVKQSNVTIQFKHREFALLHFLMMNPGRVLSRNTILENVWDRNSNITTNTVDVHISQIRKKLERNKDKKYIYTIPCSGYLLS